GHGSSQQVSGGDGRREQGNPSVGSDKLLSFSRAVELARPELQELKSSYGGLQEQANPQQQQQQCRDRRDSIDDMLANFAQDAAEEKEEEEEHVLQEAADAWFRNIQADMAKSQESANQKRRGGKQQRSLAKKIIDQHAQAMERTEMGKAMKAEKSKEVRQNEAESSWAEKLPEFGDAPIPDGVYESTLNRLAFPHATSNKLAHEANYKLSKIEQEASEKASKISRPGLIAQKRSSCTGFNPMNEIKLKTSSRLMLKGLGPSLPSNALLDIHRHQLVDNMMRRRELEEQQQQQQMQQQQQQQQQEQFETSQDSERMGGNSLMTPNENLDYLQPVNTGMDMNQNQMMELPQSYDYRVPQYDRFHPLNQRQMTNVRDYERSNRMPIDLERKDNLERRESPEANEGADNHDGNSDGDKECKSEEGAKPETDDSIVKVNIKLKLQEPAEEKSECEAANKVESKEAAASAPKNRRSKRSLEDKEQQQQPELRQQSEQHVVAKRFVHLLDDFEDHNGNRVHFGTLGNGLLTPDAEDAEGKSYPSHHVLAHSSEKRSLFGGDGNRHHHRSQMCAHHHYFTSSCWECIYGFDFAFKLHNFSGNHFHWHRHHHCSPQLHFIGRLHSGSTHDIDDGQLHGNAAQLYDNLDDLGATEERHIREVVEESTDNKGGEWQPKKEKEKLRKQEGHLKRPSMKWSGKSHNRPRTENVENLSNSYEKLITGKISGDIVSAVFEAVGNDPGMDRLLAVLERNRKCSQKQPKNFYQIRNDKSENYLRQTEEMVRRRAYIPLRPDLQEFYDLILKTSTEEQKIREKRQSALRVLAEDFSQDVRLLDSSKINQKSRIVKKLLRQYEDMPMEDQQSAAGVRDELLLDLVYLRKLSDSAERHQRNARLQEVLKQASLDEVLEKRMSAEYSPRFIKLLKTAELLKEAGEQQAKAFVGL
ncbi:hypothetical protein M5D96_009678, partial [Drosophila gunungcola]